MTRLRSVLATALLLVLGVSPAMAVNLDRQLKGSYDFTTSLHCVTVDDPGDFDGFFRPTGGAVAYHRNMTSVGVRTFDGDGGSSLVARVMVQRTDRTTFADGGSVIVITIDCPDGEYEVFPDGSFVQSYGFCTGEVVEPAGLPGAPIPFEVDDIVAGGQIGNSGKTLLIYDVGTGAQDSDTGKSICSRSGTALKR